MPIIKLWCLPKLEEERLQEISKAVVTTVCGVKELNLHDERQMTVLFPVDAMQYGIRTEIIIEVTGLTEKPERTPAVRIQLARMLSITIRGFFPQAVVECFVNSFNPAQGFWHSEDDVPINIEMPYRSATVLADSGITTMEALINYDGGAEGLLKIRGLGPKSIREIRQSLQEAGYRLGKEWCLKGVENKGWVPDR